MERFWSVSDAPARSPWDTLTGEKNDLRGGLRVARYVEGLPPREGQLERVVSQLAAIVQHQAQRIRELERAALPRPSETSIQRWRVEHPGELRARAGKTVAIHAVNGIVAEGRLLDVINRVRELGLTKETLIEKIRPVVSGK